MGSFARECMDGMISYLQMKTIRRVPASTPPGLALPQNEAKFPHTPVLRLSGAIYLGTAATPSLLDDVDSSHALVSRTMLEEGDWVVTYEDGIRYLEKAPLHYWMVAASYKLFGQNVFTPACHWS